MVFRYTIYATGHGFAQFYAQFKNDKLLSLAQIEFITYCHMKDRPEFQPGGVPMTLTSIVINGEKL